MGNGRAPCCDKSKVKRGPWSPAEDFTLISFISKNGHPNWRALPKQAGLLRCGKSCRLRWVNYLRPDVKRGNFSPEEQQMVINLHKSFGNKWSRIAAHLPGRTDNEIKNVWNTHLKKKLMAMNHDDDDQSKESSASPSSPSSNSCISYGEQIKESGLQLNPMAAAPAPQESAHHLITDNQPAAYNIINSHHHQLIQTAEQEIQPLHDSAGIDFYDWDIFGNAINVNLPKESNIVAPAAVPQEYCEVGMSQSWPISVAELGHNHHDQEAQGMRYSKWLSYLENELELGEDQQKQQHQQQQQLATQATFENEEQMMMSMLRPEIDDDIGYFQMLHSSPKGFDF